MSPAVQSWVYEERSVGNGDVVLRLRLVMEMHSQPGVVTNKTANVLDNSQTLPKAKEILPYKYNLCRIGLLYRGEAFIVTGSWKITHYILISVGLNIVDCRNEIQYKEVFSSETCATGIFIEFRSYVAFPGGMASATSSDQRL